MSEYAHVTKALTDAELYVSPETATYSDTIAAKEVRIKATSGDIHINIAYVTSDWEVDSPTDEFTISSVTSGNFIWRQLQGAGIYRFEVANNSDSAGAGCEILFSSSTSRFHKPMINRGMIKRTMNGITRRSA